MACHRFSPASSKISPSTVNGVFSEKAIKDTRTTILSKDEHDTKSLLKLTDVPSHLQFNRYIFTGYRPLSSTWQCIKSLFELHNETINILTHGFPLVYILCNMGSVLPWEDITVSYLPYLHVIAMMSPWLGSVTYHLFMNHLKGEKVYIRLLQFDMFGIWFTQTFGALTTIYASIFCLGSGLQQLVFGSYLVMSLMALYQALMAASPWERRLSFALQFFLRAALFCVRVSRYGGGDRDSTQHVILQDLLAVVGGAIGALRVPEKWMPGRLDIAGNSHHIMHVLVVLAIIHMHYAARLDLVWLSKGDCSSP